jgi:hypothetical protein
LRKSLHKSFFFFSAMHRQRSDADPDPALIDSVVKP